MVKKLLILVFLIGAFLAGSIYWLNDRILTTPLNNAALVEITVDKGDRAKTLVKRMAKNGLIENPRLYYLWLRLFQKPLAIKAGLYEIQPNAEWNKTWEGFIQGLVKTSKVTFVEGITFRDFRRILAQLQDIQHLTKEWSDKQLLQAIGARYSHPEGLFFPDTYIYQSQSTDLEIFQRAHDALIKKLDSLWSEREKGVPYQSAYEALIMASIIEKETGLEQERPEIAGVFVRRLKKKMRLQTDPTVIYGIGEKFDGNITRKHLRTYTPYNTYKIDGLPPTPISLVSEAAIYAAMHPKPGKSLYFVAKGGGAHYFSNSLEEHNRAVRKYQLKRKK